MRDEAGMPFLIKIQSREKKFETAPELKHKGSWVCLNIETSCQWPVNPQRFEFAGYEIWIIPITLEEHGGIAMKLSGGISNEDAELLMYRFLSVLSWRENSGITVAYRSGGSSPYMVGLNKKSGFVICEQFDLTEIICPEDEEPRIALALMREARSLNHHGYAFLSFWRVLEVSYPNPKARIAWMVATLPTLNGTDSKEAFNSISSNNADEICKHLFESGRCAIAHAAGKPIINPDDPRDERRLYRELPLVRQLAERAVEERFGILTRSTEYALHLYELRGWKEVFGEDHIKRLLKGVSPVDGKHADVPTINIRLRQRREYLPFENMVLAALVVDSARINLSYRSQDGLAEIRFQLDFSAERLHFSIENGIFCHDDNSIRAAEYQREILRFFRDYLMNGELQIFNADRGKLMSRKDAFMPVNCRINLDRCNANIAAAQAEVDRRKSAASSALPFQP
ncbi:methylamine utilization protein MauJ [Acetobacter sp. AAB5]|uniref:methylamine utilization protein MauJ n=1 Tax=Acetobacter sp. AAB5 TaxID=3418370 RepID=UPI003CEFEEC2